MRRRRVLQRSAGFTLVEMAVITGLTVMGIVALSQVFLAVNELHATGETRLELVQGLRVAAERITSELRLAREITVAEERTVEFRADPGSGEVSIRYYLWDPDRDGVPPYYLYRATGYSAAGDGQPLATLAEWSWSAAVPPEPATPRLEFRYHDGSGSRLSPPLSAADRDRVRRIGVTLTAQNLEEGEGAPVPSVTTFLRWSVTPRYLR